MPISTLSGGEKTKIFLAASDIRKPSVILMDEPTNHLDTAGREQLYEFIRKTPAAVLIVSHDRTLLNQLPTIYEMSTGGMQYYPMNYRQYKETVDAQTAAKIASLENSRKELKKAEKLAQKTMERQLKHASRGEKHSAGQGIARIAMGNRRDSSESSTASLGKVQQDKLERMTREMQEIRASVTETAAVKIDISNSEMTASKRLLQLSDVSYSYDGRNTLWQTAPLNISIFSGERIRIKGNNGSGKSTLLRLITGSLQPTSGTILRRDGLNILYLDQEYSCIDDSLRVYGLLESSNSRKPEHEIKTILNRFLFGPETWERKCSCLSGGERMKLALCRLLISDNAPDLIIADEPTNNIDISSMDILAETLASYSGTLLTVSHDEQFISDLRLHRTIDL